MELFVLDKNTIKHLTACKQIRSGEFKISSHIFFTKHIYIYIYIYIYINVYV